MKIANIQHFCINDGPGIRTTVFLTGCNMRCLWCHNPEMIMEEIFQYSSKDISKEELFEEICEDRLFFERSGGGVTFSGGEPVLQALELKKILKKCKEEKISTAIETAGNYSFDVIDSLLDYVDLTILDCKAVSEEVHKKCTGVTNKQILKNIKILCERHKQVWIRIPVIWNVNIDEQEMNNIGKFLTALVIERVELIPYHKIGISKYDGYNLKYLLKEVKPPTKGQLELCCDILKQYNITAVYEL